MYVLQAHARLLTGTEYLYTYLYTPRQEHDP
jgi:hypothetical protein